MEKINFLEVNEEMKWAISAITHGDDGKRWQSDEWYDDISKNGIQSTLIINGKEFNLSIVIKRLIEAQNQFVEDRAAELLKNKASDLTNQLCEFEQLINSKVREIFPDAKFEY